MGLSHLDLFFKESVGLVGIEQVKIEINWQYGASDRIFLSLSGSG